jgi:hypothetical protein
VSFRPTPNRVANPAFKRCSEETPVGVINPAIHKPGGIRRRYNGVARDCQQIAMGNFHFREPAKRLLQGRSDGFIGINKVKPHVFSKW